MPFSAVIAEAFKPYDRVAPIRSTISVSGLMSGYATKPSVPASGCCGSYLISGALVSLITPVTATPPGAPFAAVRPLLKPQAQASRKRALESSPKASSAAIHFIRERLLKTPAALCREHHMVPLIGPAIRRPSRLGVGHIRCHHLCPHTLRLQSRSAYIHHPKEIHSYFPSI